MSESNEVYRDRLLERDLTSDEKKIVEMLYKCSIGETDGFIMDASKIVHPSCESSITEICSTNT